MLGKLLLVLSLACGVGAVVGVAAQPARICQGRECTMADFWAGVNELHDLKNTFVASLREFAEAAAGSYGDEGPRLAAELDATQQSLSAWDQVMAVYETAARSAPQTAELHLALGSAYLDRLRMADALREFATAAMLDSRRADVHLLAAAAYDFAGRSADALAELEKAHAIDPNDETTSYQLSTHRLEANRPSPPIDPKKEIDEVWSAAPAFTRAGLLRHVAGIAPILPPQIYVSGFQLIEHGQLSDGVARLRAAVTQDPLATPGPESRSVLAGMRLRRGQLQAALAGLRLDPAPTDAETQRVTGAAYWADEQYDKASVALRAAITLNPRDERPRIALAEVLVAAGRAADAEKVLSELVAAIPDSGQGHYRLGQIYQADSKVGDAITQFERATACAPLTGLDHLFDVIGGLYAMQADFTHAVDAYRRRIGANPNNGEAHRKLAEIYALLGLDQPALVEYGVARALDPRDAAASTGAAQVYLRLGRFADVERTARNALAIDPAQQKARFALGTALTRLGDAPGGQRELALFQEQVDDTAARRRRALDTDALVAEGARAFAAGDYAQSAQALQGALEASSDDSRIEVQLAASLIKVGQPEAVIAHLAHASRVRNDDPEVHRLAAEAYTVMGRPQDREREDSLYRALMEQQKAQRLQQRPLLR